MPHRHGQGAVKAGTLRRATDAREYLSRDNEYLHRWFFRPAYQRHSDQIAQLHQALAQLGQDLVRAHEATAQLGAALEAYRRGTWEARAVARWRQFVAWLRPPRAVTPGPEPERTPELPPDPAEFTAVADGPPSCTDPRD